MGSACIAAKNGQGAFLVVEKWPGCILSCEKTDKIAKTKKLAKNHISIVILRICQTIFL